MMRAEILQRGGRIIDPFGLGAGAPAGWLGPWPPVPTTFPSPTNMTQQAAQNMLTTAEQHMQSQAADIFGQLATQSGVSASDWQKASLVLGNYGGALVHATNDILSGNTSIQDVQPIFGAALQLAGATPVVGLAVSAGLAILNALTGLISPGACANCGGRCVAGTCLSGTTASGKTFNVQPSGPSDPNWITWDDVPDQGVLLQALIPYYNNTIACELPNLNTSDPIQGFFYAYYTALKRAAEYSLNGYTAPTPWDVFTQVQTTWNAVHAGPNVQLAVTPLSIKPLPPGQTNPCTAGGASTGQANDPNGRSFIGGLLAGSIDGFDHGSSVNGDPGGVNVGSSSASNVYWPGQHVMLPPLGGPGSTSTGSKVALTVVGAGVVSAGGLYAYAHYNGVSIMEAIRRLKPW